jgi:hypothetical protein
MPRDGFMATKAEDWDRIFAFGKTKCPPEIENLEGRIHRTVGNKIIHESFEERGKKS